MISRREYEKVMQAARALREKAVHSITVDGVEYVPKAELQAVEERVVRLAAHAVHNANCTFMGPGDVCSCGLDALLAQEQGATLKLPGIPDVDFKIAGRLGEGDEQP